MAAWASVRKVASLPCAFWMLYCEEDRPAFLNACARYGESNSVYRVEDVVSGRMTAMFPFPFWPSS
jgi:hypothetical protein